MLILLRLFLLVVLALLLVLFNHYAFLHVVVFIANYRLDFSLSTFIILLVIIFIFLYFFIRLLHRLKALYNKLTTTN